MSIHTSARWAMRSVPPLSQGCAALRRFSVQHACRSASEATAPSVAASFLSRFQSMGPQTRSQVLDANQLQLLSLTLNRPSLYPNSPSLSNASGVVPTGTPLPPAYHLVYFTPAFLEGELGADGTDVSYNPEPPFTRRMWAGGEVQWPRGADGKPNPLRVGQEVQETTRVLSAEPKIIRKTGDEMIVVGVEKEFRNEHGVAVIDRRQTAVTLFRFSALTFNPHKIHYSTPWARDVEGHKDIVVHGPLNLISILDLWRDTRADSATDSSLLLPESISYRATSPLYAEETYRIVLDEEQGDGVSRVQIFTDEKVAMKAEIR
ncbi:hypothetical protein HFD88_004068 [Aspergillus terreus]|nr:hypothetical protein HFD88_004068 [Aspergillus terreus]